MKFVPLVLVLFSVLLPPQYISEPFNNQAQIKIFFDDPLHVANTKRVASLLKEVFSLGCICAPSKITITIDPYKKFESRVKKQLNNEMRWYLENTGLFVFAYSDLEEKDHMKIYTSIQGINNDLVIIHEAYHYTVAYCLALGVPHSEDLINKLALTFMGSKRYKNWLKNTTPE